MKRRDVPEIEDQPWCPDWLRTAMTGFLQVAVRATGPYEAAAAPIAGLLERQGTRRVVDLASGAGGPWPELAAAVENELPEPAAGRAEGLTVTLTDLYPNRAAMERLGDGGRVRYHGEPVSALEVPPELDGVRTMFTGLHHFDPDGVRAIMRAAERDGVAFAAFEASHRSWLGLLGMALSPLMALLLIPRVRPVRIRTLLFTYLVPVIPLAIGWDGVASTFRSYRASELEEIAASLESDGYEWTAAETKVKASQLPLLQLLGRPKAGPAK